MLWWGCLTKKEIITETDFAVNFTESKIIAVTGTNGKSTTCKLMQHIFRANGSDAQLGGNIGKPILDLKIGSKS